MTFPCRQGWQRPGPVLVMLLLLGCLCCCADAQGAPSRGGGGFHGGGFHGRGSRSGGSGGSPELFFIILGICLGFVAIYVLCNKLESQRHRAPEAREFLLAERQHFSDAGLPSGQWRGYYRQFGREHRLADFSLHFDGASSRVSGSGVDDVGGYSIVGLLSETGTRLAFRKQYTPGSLASNGQPNPQMNKGHAVEYRAERAGPNLGQGIKGNWYISDAPGGYVGSGTFHLWPAMDGWQQMTPSAPLEVGGHADAAQAMRGVVFNVTEDSICTVCFDRSINACLLPCSHVAVCSTCADRLNPQNCPICRAPIYAIAGADGRLQRALDGGPSAMVHAS